jgi:hypothetical protein
MWVEAPDGRQVSGRRRQPRDRGTAAGASLLLPLAPQVHSPRSVPEREAWLADPFADDEVSRRFNGMRGGRRPTNVPARRYGRTGYQ